ncbi:aminopeptidase Y [Nocardiopsis sp. NRRL B-16309]|nr:aminopeptidase Y [Nocardiopsis sp. NRRL B-16309]
MRPISRRAASPRPSDSTRRHGRAATAGVAAAIVAAGTLAASPALAEPGPPPHAGPPEHSNAPEHAGPPRSDEAALPDLVTTEAIEGHLENLNTIARYNGGNRASSTPGYDVAALYVEDQLERAGYEPYRHEYEYLSWQEHSDAVLAMTAPRGADFEVGVDFATMSYSAAGDVSAAGVLVRTEAADSGCSPEHFEGFPEGAIAVTMRGSCAFAQKTQNAADAGAAAAVVINNEDELLQGTVSEPSDIPVVGMSRHAGNQLLEAGEGLELRVAVDSTAETSTSYSVLAETPAGRDDNVVVVGGHLDSVEEGPGMNDNGSGTAFLLETAIQLAGQADPNNQVRFAFWGTEESGLVGSTRYVESLTEEQVDDIALYLNFDMIGSHNYARFVLDGRGELPDSSGAPSGSGAIAQVFEEYFDEQGQVSEPGVLSGRSDYRPFMLAGIPAGGLFSGADGVKTEAQVEWYGGTAGEMFDPYYHTDEDTLDKINTDALSELSAAGAHGVEFFADSTLPVNGVAPLSSPVISFDRIGDELVR